MICEIMMLFISGEFPTTSALALRTYGEHIDNSFAQWLGFSDNGMFVVNAIVYGSYFLNIWVYVVMSKSFHERPFDNVVHNLCTIIIFNQVGRNKDDK